MVSYSGAWSLETLGVTIDYDHYVPTYGVPFVSKLCILLMGQFSTKKLT